MIHSETWDMYQHTASQGENLLFIFLHALCFTTRIYNTNTLVNTKLTLSHVFLVTV